MIAAMKAPTFLVAMNIIAKYSEMFEPVANILQGVSVDLLKCSNHIEILIKALKEDRTNAVSSFANIF